MRFVFIHRDGDSRNVAPNSAAFREDDVDLLSGLGVAEKSGMSLESKLSIEAF
jgi:hypothetical protein